uniref:Uncharacterized protein n=1 Tax=Arundo donax TaxID=35708 RepID=A0A0A8YGK3_ARUDO
MATGLEMPTSHAVSDEETDCVPCFSIDVHVFCTDNTQVKPRTLPLNVPEC